MSNIKYIDFDVDSFGLLHLCTLITVCSLQHWNDCSRFVDGWMDGWL